MSDRLNKILDEISNFFFREKQPPLFVDELYVELINEKDPIRKAELLRKYAEGRKGSDPQCIIDSILKQAEELEANGQT